MTSPVITNSLLRLDRLIGEPPKAFERPNNDLDFFVLELGEHQDVKALHTQTAKVLKKHGAFLDRMRRAGGEVVLFVEWGAGIPVIKFDASFLKVLSERGVSLECYHEKA